MSDKQNVINHVVFTLDASSSMTNHAQSLIKVADAQVAHLARRSQELKQETRVTVYSFADQAKCLIYDMDVLRLPSIATLYRPYGNTALIDATILSLDDLAMTPEKYGDHSFLEFVFTDGEENRSSNRPAELKRRLDLLPDHWTLAVLVPNAHGVYEAKKFGFAPGNIAVWDATSQQGVEEAMERITTATDAYMSVLRTSGIRGTRSLFSTGADAVNAATVSASGLKPLDSSEFMLVPVPKDSPIKEFVEATGRIYVTGNAYYQLGKTETIQANKRVAVVEKKTAKVFLGREARDLIGLPAMEVRVKPDWNPEYDIYVQSTSVNRKLIAGTKLLMLEPAAKPARRRR